MTLQNDHHFMTMALKEGKKALLRNDFPVGAVLVVNGKVVAKMNNSNLSKKTWGDHAETSLLLKFSQKIRKAQAKNKETQVELYSTLEPCMMCFGCAMMHRVDRIIYACPDPRGGATGIDVKGLPNFYKDMWPQIKKNVLAKEAHSMFVEFMQTNKQFKETLFKKLFLELKIK